MGGKAQFILQNTVARTCNWLKLLPLLLLIFTFQTQASPTSLCQGLLKLESLEPARLQKLSFNDTEVFRRNNDIGLQQKGDLTFAKWIEVGEERGAERNYVGLTDEGRLYHLVEWTESSGLKRRVARPLAGEQKLKELFVFENEILVAVDDRDQVLLYSPAEWSKSPVGRLLKQGLTTWSLSSAALLSYMAYFHPDLIPMSGHLSDYVAPLGSVLTAKMITAFVQLHRYETSNTFPDGFLRTKIAFQNPQQLLFDLQALPPADLEQIFARRELTHPVQDRLYPPMIEAATEGVR